MTTDRAMALIHAGRPAEAARLLADELPQGGLDADGSRLLAKLWFMAGRRDDGLRLMERALALAPDLPRGRFELGVMLLESGRTAEAEAAFRRAVAIDPGDAGAWFNLGWLCRQGGRDDDAAAAFAAAVDGDPGHGPAWFNLGNVRRDQGQRTAAQTAYRRALAVAPAMSGAVLNLGDLLRQDGADAEAERLYTEALSRDPGQAAVWRALGDLLADTGRQDDADRAFRAGLRAAPGDGAILADWALHLFHAGRTDAAEAVLDMAPADAPPLAAHRNLLGLIRMRQGRVAEAETALRQAIDLAPDFTDAHNNLAMVLSATGRLIDAAAIFRRLVQADPDNLRVFTNYLFALQHSPDATAAEIAEAHREFGRRAERVVPLALAAAPPRHGRRLRVGFLSPDLRDHAVAYLFEPVPRLLDRARFEVFCYYLRRRGDATTDRLRSMADHWRNLAGMAPPAAAAAIAADRIDILVDLAGHTADNGLAIMAYKPAHIQATWLGYPGTTGLGRMDYRLCGNGADVPGVADPAGTERLVRVSRWPLFRPPPSPPVRPPPVLARGHVTFGSFNRYLKVNDRVVACWSRILLRCPGARLLLVVGDDARTAPDAVRARFAAHGVAAGRIDVAAQQPLDGFLDLLGGADIALDPFPYSGGTTSLFTLWMGVPVVTLARLDARSITGLPLTAIGLPDLVAADEDEYVARAVALAGDAAGLTRLRQSLRARLLASPMMDEAGQVRALETVLERMWDHYRPGETP